MGSRARVRPGPGPVAAHRRIPGGAGGRGPGPGGDGPVVPVRRPRRGRVMSAADELVPCPTCWLPADLVAPTDVDLNYHSHCPRGHDNTLVPAVLRHLRSLMARAT